MLPDFHPDFLNEMRFILPGDAYQHWLGAYQYPAVRGLRPNILKTDTQELHQTFSNLNVSPLADEMLILNATDHLGRHPYFHGGLFYIQDPSASMVVPAMEIGEGDHVADLCAAPGGKSTQILSALGGTGFLLSNEFDRARSRILHSNLERWGHDNFAMTQQPTNRLAQRFPQMFDKVLVDAPCSGEGLYRKQPTAVQYYSANNIQKCQQLQLAILEDAYHMVRCEGEITYSTCTFNRAENEDVIISFLDSHPDCECLKLELPLANSGFGKVGQQVARYFTSPLGEGHFIAKLKVHRHGTQALPLVRKPVRISDPCLDLDGDCAVFNEQQTYVSQGALLASGTGWLTQGIEVYDHHRYAHSLALSARRRFNRTLEVDEDEALDYLYGLSLEKTRGGIHLVCYRGHPLGFVKGVENRLNNLYPKGLRNMRRTWIE